MELWYIRKQHGAADLWHFYFAYRVRNENDPNVRCFVEIRHLAESLCHQTQAEYIEMVNTLCWLALERYVGMQGYREGRPQDGDTPNLRQNLLGVAAYLDNLPLARQLLSDGHCPVVSNHAVPSPMQLAAWAGNADMLRLLQEYLPDFENIPFEADSWRGKTGPGSIKGASVRGDMNILRLAIYPPSRATPDNKDFAGYSFGRVDPHSKQGRDLQSTLLCAKTPETFQYIQTFFQDPGLDSRFLLVRYPELGNVDMRGADPNYQTMQQRGSPLRAAAMSGSMTIMCKLINSGAKPIDNDWWPLFEAVRLEHTAMVRLLLDLNIGDVAARSRILELTLDLGLDSMAQLLQHQGIRLPS
ncbi:ankyrin [Daldinia grandis]|nr:ankyrin [Daldinia grandis]